MIFRSSAGQADHKIGRWEECRRRCPRPIPKDEGEDPFMVTIRVQNLINFVAEVFSHSESSEEEARRIATYLTTANLTGHDSHGVIRVPVYIKWKKRGSVV